MFPNLMCITTYGKPFDQLFMLSRHGLRDTSQVIEANLTAEYYYSLTMKVCSTIIYKLSGGIELKYQSLLIYCFQD